MNSNDIKQIVLRLNDEDVSKKLENIKLQLANANKQKNILEQKGRTGNLTAKETKDLQFYSKQVENAERQLTKLRGTKESVDRTLHNISSVGIKDLKNTLKSLNRELESGSIERGSDVWKRYQAAIKETKEELQKIAKAEDVQENFFVRFGKKIVPFAKVENA